MLLAAVMAVGFKGVRSQAATAVPTRPSILYILCDDLGIGDVHAFNPERGKIPTPNMDRLASQGMSFTDAHATSAVCTPSRYGILTGRYNWRSRLQKGVLNGNSPPLLEPGRLTVPALLKSLGYDTDAIGKWHLGLLWDDRKYHGVIIDGPLQHGFDHFFGIAASLDMPPFAWIDDDHFPEYPSVTKKWVRTGAAAPSFEAVDALPTVQKKAIEYLNSHTKGPFFLYVALPSPHTPLVPTPQWQGKSPLNLGPYADYVMETDDVVGKILDALDADHLSDSTLVYFTSDNGCAPYIGVKALEAKGHFPSAQFRGYKSDIWDGGHRIPLVIRWPGVTQSGTRYDETVCLSDLMATTAAITGFSIPPNAGEDSVSILPALTGDKAPLRDAEVQHSIDGNFAIRVGSWKLELCAGSGGWSDPREPAAAKLHLPKVQLYDLATDIGEQHNLQAEHPEKVASMTALLEKYVNDGRSTPGPPQKNDVPIDIWKTATTAENTTGD
jgi:arylsulfatase A